MSSEKLRVTSDGPWRSNCLPTTPKIFKKATKPSKYHTLQILVSVKSSVSQLRLLSSSVPLVDCEGRLVVAGQDGGSGLASAKMRVRCDGPWRSNCVSNDEDL